LHMVQLMLLHAKTPSSLASFKYRLVLLFWYWLTQVVLEKRPLNGCCSSSSTGINTQKTNNALILRHLIFSCHQQQQTMSLISLSFKQKYALTEHQLVINSKTIFIHSHKIADASTQSTHTGNTNSLAEINSKISTDKSPSHADSRSVEDRELFYAV